MLVVALAVGAVLVLSGALLLLRSASGHVFTPWLAGLAVVLLGVTIAATAFEGADVNSAGSNLSSNAILLIWLAGFVVALWRAPRAERAAAWAAVVAAAFTVGYLSETWFAGMGESYGDQRAALGWAVAVVALVAAGIHAVIARASRRRQSNRIT